MSKYLNIDELNISDQGLLVATLQNDMTFRNPVGLEVESHAIAVHLFGIGNHKRPETAEVIIRQKWAGGASNDIGFKRQPSGNFAPIISEFDSYNYGQVWRDHLSQKYGERKYEQDMYEGGFQLESKLAQTDGTTAMTFSRMGGF